MRICNFILAAGLAVWTTGCAGYKLGPSNGMAAGEKSVQIVPFINSTLEPRLSDAVTSALRKELQRDGTYKLATRNAGDIVVNGKIIQYHRQEQSFVPEDIITARDYRVSLTAQIIARDRVTGRVLLDEPVTGFTLMRVGADIASSDRQAVPLMAEDLARKVVALLADGSW